VVFPFVASARLDGRMGKSVPLICVASVAGSFSSCFRPFAIQPSVAISLWTNLRCTDLFDRPPRLTEQTRCEEAFCHAHTVNVYTVNDTECGTAPIS
jgi:hypothetical protein